MKTIKFLQESFETKERFQQEKLDLIREEICELIGVNPNLQKKDMKKIIFSI